MHTHGTAVLTGPVQATPAGITGVSARDQWLARSTEDVAKALATGNASLLPVLPELVFCLDPGRCPDCEGTGYSPDDFDLCSCMNRALPAYDFRRYIKGEVRMIIGMSRQDLHTGQADVWVPCQHCTIGPVKNGPYCPHCHDHVIQVPWVPDCPTCNDTGWAFKRHIPARDFLC